MARVRRIANWCTLAALGTLAVLCAVGAFLGVERASSMFNSIPLMVLWAAVALLLLVSVVFVKPVRRSPALVVAHLAPLLILTGGFLGSSLVHSLIERVSDRPMVRSGYLVLSEGETTDRVLAEDFASFVGELPFQLRLEDFEIEYYKPRDGKWALALVRPGEDNGEPIQTAVEWQKGESVSLPGLDVNVTVLEYLANARPIYGEQTGPAVEVSTSGGESIMLPAEKGQEVSPTGTSITVSVEEVLPLDAEDRNPVLRLEIAREAGTYSIYMTPRFAAQPRSVDDLELRYVLARPTGARSDVSSETPAMKVRLRHEDKQVTQWLIPRSDAKFIGTDLTGLLESGAGAAPGQRGAVLYLVKPQEKVKDYKSHLAVLDDGEVVLRKTIEVNYPLHYRGYHIYQSTYGGDERPYVGLLVRADTGLYLVYAGLGLLAAGMFWWGWAKPVRRFWPGGGDAD